MGQLCCFPFSRAEEKISGKRAEADDAELQRLSRKLVEEAVLRAVQQYKHETQRHNGGGATEQATPPPAHATEQATPPPAHAADATATPDATAASDVGK